MQVRSSRWAVSHWGSADAPREFTDGCLKNSNDAAIKTLTGNSQTWHTELGL